MVSSYLQAERGNLFVTDEFAGQLSGKFEAALQSLDPEAYSDEYLHWNPTWDWISHLGDLDRPNPETEKPLIQFNDVNEKW